MAMYWMWRIAAAIVPRIPLALARPLFTGIGLLAWAIGGESRRRAERNLRHIPALANNTARLHEAVRGVFVTSALNYLDILRGRSLTNDDIHRGWNVKDEDILEDALTEGRGAVIVSGHFGNFEFAASRLAHRYQMIVPVERIKPARLFEFFRSLRNHHNLHVIAADSRETMRQMTETLRNGGILLIISDRHIAGTSTRLDFFDEPSNFATAPMALALRTGAPIICAFSWRTSPSTFDGVFYRLRWDESDAQPVDGHSTKRRIDQTIPALRAYIRLMEQVISAHPEAWVSALAPVWEVPAPIRASEHTPVPAAPEERQTQEVLSSSTHSHGLDFAKPSSVE